MPTAQKRAPRRSGKNWWWSAARQGEKPGRESDSTLSAGAGNHERAELHRRGRVGASLRQTALAAKGRDERGRPVPDELQGLTYRIPPGPGRVKAAAQPRRDSQVVTRPWPVRPRPQTLPVSRALWAPELPWSGVCPP